MDAVRDNSSQENGFLIALFTQATENVRTRIIGMVPYAVIWYEIFVGPECSLGPFLLENAPQIWAKGGFLDQKRHIWGTDLAWKDETTIIATHE